jgi:hypothetical protein
MRLRSGLLCFVPGPAGDRGGSLWKASDVSRDHVPYCAANVNAADKDTPGVGRARYSNGAERGFGATWHVTLHFCAGGSLPKPRRAPVKEPPQHGRPNHTPDLHTKVALNLPGRCVGNLP